MMKENDGKHFGIHANWILKFDFFSLSMDVNN
jgi:hypothetical protein